MSRIFWVGIFFLQISQRKPTASSSGMIGAGAKQPVAPLRSSMPVHILDLANTSTCTALEIECRNEKSTGLELIRPPGRKRRAPA
jgi:hypothetical protein